MGTARAERFMFFHTFPTRLSRRAMVVIVYCCAFLIEPPSSSFQLIGVATDYS